MIKIENCADVVKPLLLAGGFTTTELKIGSVLTSARTIGKSNQEAQARLMEKIVKRERRVRKAVQSHPW
jgi:hypothetical protein